MSLFAGLFKQTAPAAPTLLFSDSSRFKRSESSDGKGSKAAPPSQKKPSAAGKRKQSTAAGASEPAGKKTKAAPTAAAVRTTRQASKLQATPASAAKAAGGDTSAEQLTKPPKKKRSGAEATAVKASTKAVTTEGKTFDEKKKKNKTKTKASSKVGKAEPAQEEEEEKEEEGPAAGGAEEAASVDEADALQRTVFVGNLPPGVKRKSLTRLFAQYGAVESARLRSIPIKADAKMPRRAAVASGNVDAARGSLHAYIVFEDPSAAEAALAHNMQEFEGNHLRVDFAGANKLKLQAARKKGGAAAVAAGGGRDVRYDPARTVFVGNLHLEAEDEDVIRFFVTGVGGGAASEVEAVRVVRDQKTSMGKGIAFVLFKSKAGRRAALGLDGRELRGRPLRVTPAKSTGSSAAGFTTTSGGGSSSAAEWQGVSATLSGKRRGPVGEGGGKGGSSGAQVTGKRKAGGKRPAVAARKARLSRVPSAAAGRVGKKPRTVPRK